MIETGIIGTATLTVDESRLAKNVGSGTVALLSSPIMIALMEEACWKSLVPHQEAGQCTVGISVNVKHTRATPLGMKVTATSTLAEIKGSRLIFEVVAEDEKGEIGRGTHTRVAVDEKSFEAAAYEA